MVLGNGSTLAVGFNHVQTKFESGVTESGMIIKGLLKEVGGPRY